MSPIFDTVCVLPLSGLLFWSSVPPIFGDEYCTAINYICGSCNNEHWGLFHHNDVCTTTDNGKIAVLLMSMVAVLLALFNRTSKKISLRYVMKLILEDKVVIDDIALYETRNL